MIKKIFSAILAVGLSIGSVQAFAETNATAENGEALTAICEEYTLPTLQENALEKYYESKISSHISFYGAYDSEYEKNIFWGLSANQKKELESAVREITNMVDSSWSDLKKALFINDYMALTSGYDLTYSKYTAYDNIVGHTSVCQGYAEAYWLLMNRLGIDCKIVTSWNLNHAWNLVKINGKWYHVDVTWNDPIPNMEGRARHEYFLLSDVEMYNSGHNTSDWRFEYEGSVSAVGLASAKTYDGYAWRNSDRAIAISGSGFYFVDKESGSLNLLSENGSVKRIIDLSDYKWYVKDGYGSWWVGTFSGCGVFKDRIYFNTPKEIKSCSLNGSDIRTEYTLSAEETSVGDLYGIYILNTVLYYTVAEEPNPYNDSISIQKSTDIFTMGSVLFGKIASSAYGNSSVKVEMSRGGKSFSAEILNDKYAFKNIPAGTYTLKISKPAHCPKTITVSVNSSASKQLNDEIHLYGDINGDGKVNAADILKARLHSKGSQQLSDYDFAVADVTKDGKVNSTDILKLKLHAKGSAKLW